MKKIYLTIAAALLMPSTAWAAICPFSDAKAVKCEIPLCVQAGFPSRHGCRPALKEFIIRAFKRKPPVPLPPECLCTWVPAVVIPTNQYGVPFFIEESLPTIPSIPYGAATSSIQYASATEMKQTPYEKSPPKPTSDMTPFPLMAQTSNIITDPTQDQVRERTARALKEQNSYYTNCNTSMFKSRRSGTCYIVSGGERIDLAVTRDRYRRWPSRYRYEYIVVSRKLDGSGDTHKTHMKIKHDRLESCQIFTNGRAVSDRNCNVSEFHSMIAASDRDVDDEYEDYEDYYDLDSYPDGLPNPDDTLNYQLRKKNPKDNGVMVFE